MHEPLPVENPQRLDETKDVVPEKPARSPRPEVAQPVLSRYLGEKHIQ
ncbi:MAG: hypothetical protein ACLQVI_24605 [Polyangiaceae bacterium]